MPLGTPRPWAAYAAFAAFGALWGVWGASIPAIRDEAGVSEGQLGTALLFIGAGALPAMWLIGRVVDRWRHLATAVLLALLGGTGLLVALTAEGMAGLCVGLAALGAVSGAADVAINATAGSIQSFSGGPIVGRAHGAFSLAVAASSLGAGALYRVGSPTPVAFGLVAAASAALAVGMVTGRVEAPTRALAQRSAGTDTEACESSDTSPASLLWAPLALFGGLGALAFAVENAFQSWSALFLRDAVDAGPALAAAGPAVFAGVAAATRFAASGPGARRPTAVLVVGSAVAAVGSITVAGSATVPVALLGFALAAAGTAVLFPTLISVLTERVPDALRGTATSRVTGLSYVGFLLGPVYFGWWAEWTTLAGAMLAVAGLAALLTVLVGALMRRDHQVSVGAAGVAP